MVLPRSKDSYPKEGSRSCYDLFKKWPVKNVDSGHLDLGQLWDRQTTAASKVSPRLHIKTYFTKGIIAVSVAHDMTLIQFRNLVSGVLSFEETGVNILGERQRPETVRKYAE